MLKFDNIYIYISIDAEDVSASSNSGDSRSSKELVNVQIQSDDVDSTETYSEVESERVELNGAISYEEIDRALAMHIKRSIDKIHEISAILQGILYVYIWKISCVFFFPLR